MEYSCICCGTCCQKYQPWLTPTEVKEIAGKLGITPQKFLSDFTDHRWPGTESFLLVHKKEACIFLQINPENDLALCSIHDFKPVSCRAWATGTHKSECQNGLMTILGITVDSGAKLIGTDEQMNKLTERVKIIQEL